MTLPWKEMLLASLLLPALMAIGLLIVNKYPASRFLGKLLIVNLTVLIGLEFFQSVWIPVVLLSISLYLYCRAFFLQNTRIGYQHLIPILLVVVFTSIPDIPETFIRILSSSAVIGYLIATLKFIYDEGKVRGIPWFKNPGSRLIWYRNFTGWYVFVLLYYLWPYSVLKTEYAAISILITLCFVYFQLIRESAFLSPMLLGNKYQKSALSAELKYTIISKLNTKLANEKFYLDSSISLKSLAASLQTTTHHLSQVINEHKGMSFQDLISQYRIREAKQLLKNPAHQQTKIETIAAMVGYYSKSAFNTAFKKYSGLTPKEFKHSKNVRSYRKEPFLTKNEGFSNDSAVSWYQKVTQPIQEIMTRNFLKIFYRMLIRNKAFTLINITGLTLGFCCSIFIYLFITDELAYDRQLPDSDHIYRVNWISDNPQTRTPHPLAQAMAESFPEVEAATSLSPWYGAGLNKQTIRVKNTEKDILFEEPDFFFADSTFLDVFELEVLQGDADALQKPWSFVITDKMAAKYFGNEPAIGKELVIDDMPVAVSAVVKAMPEKSHFHFNALIPYATLKKINPLNPWLTWDDFGHFNYIKTAPGTDIQTLQTKIPDWVSSYLNWSKEGIEALKRGDFHFELQPLQDIHLHSHLRWELENNGNINYIYILGFTLGFIILIVVINYVNLTTAKSLTRAKEVGLRKSMGAMGSGLKGQFFTESLFLCVIALVLALGLSVILLNFFNYISHKSFLITDILNTSLLIKFFIATVILAILSGYYPAVVLSSFDPSKVLKGQFANSGQGTRLRSSLVVVQFFASAVMITSTVVVMKQINFMKNKDLGFDQNAVINIKVHKSVARGSIDLDKIRAMENDFKTLPGVLQASAISNLPGEQFNQNPIYTETNPANRIDASELFVDYDLFDVLDLKLAAGRMFDPQHTDDLQGRNFIINETAARQLGLKNAVGTEIVWESEKALKGNIIGIVKDFHFRSMHEHIQPLIIKLDPYAVNHLVLKLDGHNLTKTLSDLKQVYRVHETELPFDFTFLNQQLADLYDSEVRTMNIFFVFTGIALFLACLGLLGMALTILNQRIKEVGIRKILGASAGQIMTMILSRFVQLIFLALLAGLPAGYYLMQSWLTSFSYQVAIGFLPFLIAGLTILGIAIASVSVVVLKISFSNPVDSLRNE